MKEHPAQSTLHHMLGIGEPSRCNDPPYRNYFAASPKSDPNMTLLEQLVEDGLAVIYRRNAYIWFTATEKGQELALRTRPRYSKKKLRYLAFLRCRDAFPDLTFREFLTNPEFKGL